MDEIRCFNCERSLFREVEGDPSHLPSCKYRNISIAGEQLFKKRQCKHFELRMEKNPMAALLKNDKIPDDFINA